MRGRKKEDDINKIMGEPGENKSIHFLLEIGIPLL
jgi:hypothetical protein